MIISKAILSSWGWLSAQATHLGFSPMTELTYPLVTQGSITDGQTWTWCTYQLNSVDLSTNKPEETRQEQELHLQQLTAGGTVDPIHGCPLLKIYPHVLFRRVSKQHPINVSNLLNFLSHDDIRKSWSLNIKIIILFMK